MRFLTGMLIALNLASPAIAARPDARTMTCQRFVSGSAYCDYWERAANAWTKTKDNPKCRIGHVCEERMGFDGLLGR